MSRKLTISEFVEKAKVVHGDRYNYDKVKYTGNKVKVEICCSNHGIFLQTPNHHLLGRGCSKCGDLLKGSSLKSNSIIFIEKAKKIHDNKYSYSDVKYISAIKKVAIKCLTHGLFLQTPNGHLDGHGCKKCSIEKRSEMLRGLLKNSPQWVDRTKNRLCTLYLIKLKNEKELFYKIGITSNDIKKRLSHIPYSSEIFMEITTYNAQLIYDIEQEIHKELKKYKYYPKISFNGRFECYKINDCVIDIFLSKIKNVT